jgi:hypothetical protein
VNNKILAFIAMAAVGAVVSVGSADTVINAFVQQFGATPHTVITTPNDVRNVQIDWRFSDDYNVITACDVTFDQVLPNNTIVICKLSGHDADPQDGVITNGTAGPIVGFGQILANGVDQRMDVAVQCDPGASLRPQVVSGNFTTDCDVQDIDDVKVIVVGKETCNVTVPGQVPAHCVPQPADCNSPNIIDFCIDGDGIATPGRGAFTASVGNSLSTWPASGIPAEGIDAFNIPGGVWNNVAVGGSDIHLEDPAGACSTALRDAVHNNNVDVQDCVVLDLDGSLVNGQPVDCDFEGAIPFTFCPPFAGANSVTFIDANGDGGYNNGEDIIFDVNGNGIFD